MVRVRCPNCEFEGKPRRKDSPLGLICLLILFLASFVIWPLFLLVFIVFLAVLLGRKKLECPNCGRAHPVPLR
jgi:hypothetical protein